MGGRVWATSGARPPSVRSSTAMSSSRTPPVSTDAPTAMTRRSSPASIAATRMESRPCRSSRARSGSVWFGPPFIHAKLADPPDRCAIAMTTRIAVKPSTSPTNTPIPTAIPQPATSRAAATTIRTNSTRAGSREPVVIDASLRLNRPRSTRPQQEREDGHRRQPGGDQAKGDRRRQRGVVAALAGVAQTDQARADRGGRAADRRAGAAIEGCHRQEREVVGDDRRQRWPEDQRTPAKRAEQQHRQSDPEERLPDTERGEEAEDEERQAGDPVGHADRAPGTQEDADGETGGASTVIRCRMEPSSAAKRLR